MKRPQRIQSLLLQWFRKNKRPLPWRKTRDPYKIWISEVMLQQTQVKTVIPYYRRWIKNFPNLAKLAQAPLSRVLKCWEGLGYYHRARNLHQAAKMIVRRLGGEFPDSRKELEGLPGIGRYTAGAISSIAFNRPEPVLDGNVKRVLARIFATKESIDKRSGEKKLWEISKQLVAETRKPGDFNQALMELGATVCLPENPACAICPLGKLCKAHRLRQEIEFPRKSKKVRTEKLRETALVLWKNRRVLLEKRPLGGRWGGLWTFPYWTLPNGQREENFLERKVREDLKLRVRNLKPRMEIKYGFTKYRVKLRVYEGELKRGQSPFFYFFSFFLPQRLAHLPLPRPHEKIAKAIQAHA